MTRARPSRQLAAAADAGSFLGTFALVFVAIGGLFAIDTSLAKLEEAESRSEARQVFQEGTRLAAEGRNLDAADQFRTALSDERTNPVYQRALASALLAAGKIADAEAVLTDRLQHDPTDAAASLVMARALVRDGKLREGISYYHRAIYGRWDQDSLVNRVHARFELIDLLARNGARRALLAELLPLQDDAPTDVATRKRVARLFITAGSPVRAVEIFQDILRHGGGDADTYAGLGEAEFEQGNCRAALTSLETAARLDPGNAGIAARLAVCHQVVALDPTLRRLSSAEQYRRSLTLVDLALGSLASCAGPAPVRPVTAAIDSARAALAQRAREPREEAVGANLDLARRVWQVRRQECPKPVQDSEKSLALVLDKLTQ
jgi:tetratricopeptide (TPR) repeat protein